MKRIVFVSMVLKPKNLDDQEAEPWSKRT